MIHIYINPYILLSVGLLFAIAYTAIYIAGFCRTRINREKIQSEQAISFVRTWDLTKNIKSAEADYKTISIQNNIFKNRNGINIDMSKYTPFIAIGNSSIYPDIQEGNLVLIDEGGNISYIFEVPDIRNYK